MAFNKENFYQEGNSQEYFFDRTNPLANAGNVEKLRIKDCCCEGVDIQLVAEGAIGGGSLLIRFGNPTDLIDSRYVKIVVTDSQGNFTTAVGTGLVPNLTVDISTLNPNQIWTVNFVIEVGSNPAIDCPCMKEYDFTFNPYSGGFLIDTTTLGAQVLSLLQSDNSTVVIDGGSYDLGSYPVGGISAPFTVYVKNIGDHVLTVSSVSFTADVLGFTLTPYGDVIYPNQSIAYFGAVDTSGLAGSYTGTITINSDDPQNAVYTIDIDFTLV